MASSAASYPGACPHLSRPVPTRVPTLGLESWACPNRPGLFPSRTYSDCRSSFPALHIQRNRLGHVGRLEQASNGAGFGVPTSRQTSGRSGRQAAGAAVASSVRSFRFAGAGARVLPRGSHRGQFVPRFSCVFRFRILVPLVPLARWLMPLAIVPREPLSRPHLGHRTLSAAASAPGCVLWAPDFHAARSANRKGDAARGAMRSNFPRTVS